MFENGVLRDVVTEDWRKLHNELRDLYCLPGSIRVIEWMMMSGACGMYGGGGEESNTERVSMRKPDGKREF